MSSDFLRTAFVYSLTQKDILHGFNSKKMKSNTKMVKTTGGNSMGRKDRLAMRIATFA